MEDNFAKVGTGAKITRTHKVGCPSNMYQESYEARPILTSKELVISIRGAHCHLQVTGHMRWNACVVSWWST
jgi:hypothetical protein